ncbi:MAG: CHAD domain-containing protein [Dehalococcoidia bacterium]
MTTVDKPRTRRRIRTPRPLAALIDDVLRRADADLAEDEAVHDLRVACRRLEAGTRVSQDVLRRSRLRDVRDAAKSIRRAFDQARDLEVIAGELGPIDGLTDRFRTAVREASDKQAAGAQRRGRVGDAIKTLKQIREDLADDAAPQRGALAAILHEHITALFDELDRLLPESTDAAVHEVRIDVKKLRYEMEIGAPVFPRLRPQVKRLKRLQDILGRHQDSSVGLIWSEQLVDGAFASTVEDRTALMRYYAALRREQRRRLRRLLGGWRTRDMRGRFQKAIGVPPSAGAATVTI